MLNIRLVQEPLADLALPRGDQRPDLGLAVRGVAHLQRPRRSNEGVQEPVFWRGQAVAHTTKYSDLLLIFRAKKELPEYRDSQPSQQVDVRVKVYNQVDLDNI